MCVVWCDWVEEAEAVLWAKCRRVKGVSFSPPKILFIYLARESKHEQGRGAEGEVDSSLSKEPDIEPDPRMPGPWLEVKADTQPTELPRSLREFLYN